MTNIKIALELGAKKLKNSSPTPMLDAEILLCLVLNKNRLDLINIENKTLTNDQHLKFMSSIIRRSNFEPIAYIIKQKEFWSKNIHTNKNTLIPRPETEVLVDMTLTFLKNKKRPTFLDLGAGTGCISIALASEIKHIKGVAIDNCNKTLKICKQNLIHNKLSDRVIVKKRDILNNKFTQKFDLLISNPPYLREREFINICKSIKYFEPKKTLVADKYDGLKYLHFIIKNYRNNLKKNGILALEIGNYQFKKVGFMLKNYRFRLLKSFNLINNDIRCIIATKI